MKKALIVGASLILIFFATSSISPAQAKMGCPYEGSPNWQGLCDVTTDDGNSYFGPLIEVPDDIPIPPSQPIPQETQQPNQSNSGTQTQNNFATSIVTNPVFTVSPNILGDGNNFSSTINNINTTNNTNSNTTNNTVVHSVSNNLQNTFNVVEVSGGYVIIGENGFAEFFSTNRNNQTGGALESIRSEEIFYVDKANLSPSILRAVNRIPATTIVGKSIKLSSILGYTESITEDICTVNKRKIRFFAEGQCIIEVSVGSNIYEHEIIVTN